MYENFERKINNEIILIPIEIKTNLLKEKSIKKDLKLKQNFKTFSLLLTEEYTYGNFYD